MHTSYVPTNYIYSSLPPNTGDPFPVHTNDRTMFSFWGRAPWAAQQQPPAAAAVPPAAAAAFDSSATTAIPAAAEEGPAYPQIQTQTHNHQQPRRKREAWGMEEEARQVGGCFAQQPRYKVARLEAQPAAAGGAGAFSGSFPAPLPPSSSAPAQAPPTPAAAAVIPAVAAVAPTPAAAMEEEVGGIFRSSQEQQQQEQAQAAQPPTLAGQSRRHTPAYIGGHPAQQNALALLMARSRAAASAPSAPAAVAGAGGDCGVCPLLPTSGRACQCKCGGRRYRSTSEQDYGPVLTTCARPITAPPKVSAQPQPPQQQLQQLMLPISYGGSSHQHTKAVAVSAAVVPAAAADCWRAVARCRHCDRGICKTCLRGCEGCGETYCSLCSTIDYGGPAERVLCLECSQRVGSQSQQQESGGGSSMMDLS